MAVFANLPHMKNIGTGKGIENLWSNVFIVFHLYEAVSNRTKQRTEQLKLKAGHRKLQILGHINATLFIMGLVSGQNVQIISASVSASLSVFYVLAILYSQSLSLSYLLFLSSALNNLSCNATPGAVLNLLLLAKGPRKHK